MDIEFSCRHCGQLLTVDEAGIGETVQCPKCNQSLVIPALEVDASPASPPSGGKVETLSAFEAPATNEVVRGSVNSNGVSMRRRLVHLLSLLLAASVVALGIWMTFFQATERSPFNVAFEASIKPQTASSAGRPLSDAEVGLPAPALNTPQKKISAEAYLNGEVDLPAAYLKPAVSTAFHELRAKAEKGDAKAQYELGEAFATGKFGVTKDDVEAVKWFRKAAEQDSAIAQSALGWCYANGIGVVKDEVEAVKWLRKAAEQNDAKSQCLMGISYANGQGVAKDDVEAVKWYRRAAEQSFPPAQYALGACYADGQGMAKDDVAAIVWYRKAAEQDFGEAQFNLGVCYRDGRGVTKDEVEAVKWFYKAAQLNHADAQSVLSGCYTIGQGVAENYVEAYKWTLISASQGSAGSKEFQAILIILEGYMTREEIEEAKQQASVFKPAKRSKSAEEQLAALRAKAAEGEPQSQNELGRALFFRRFGAKKDAEEAVKLCRKAAEKNIVIAQCFLGARYSSGEGVAKDEAEAVKWYRLAAEQGYAMAQFRLGVCYAYGRGVAKDEVEGVKWLRKASEQNDIEALYFLGVCYANGKGVAKDEVEAVKWYRLAAEQGYAMAQFKLGVSYARGQGVTQNDLEAAKWFHEAAARNHPEAQFRLGICYTTGQGVTKDSVEAVKWYRKAVKQNSAGAQFQLGCSYSGGEGVAKDDVEAARWYRKAAEQGYARSQFSLGLCCQHGLGVAKDEAEAVNWYRKAAEQNHDLAQVYLGECYQDGQGVAKDEVEAVKWFHRAAEQGNAIAQRNLGISYGRGEGVAKDSAEAIKWYLKAAEQNDVIAQCNLGAIYARGEGVPKDYVEAYKWRLLAAAQGNETAKKAVASLENSMTREQIAEGQKLARNFKVREAPKADADPRKDFTQERPESTGTGFFITEDGYLVTNQHVVKNATAVQIVTATGNLRATVVKVDTANDLALLKIAGKFDALPVVASRGVRLGVTVATVGFPNIGLQGFAPKLAKGEIAALSGPRDDARYFQISVPVQPGNSGGALVDEHGNVVGVVSAKLSARAALTATGALPENVNYAVKSSYLMSFLESVPEVAAKLKEPETKERKFEDVVKSAEQAAVLVLVY